MKPDEDIESHVAAFYSKMTRPALSDLRIELTGVDLNRTYPRDLPDLFEGGQIVWAGRYRQSGRTTIKVTGKVAGERRSLEFPAELAGSGGGSSYDFVERLWAVRRLGDLIDQIDLHGQNREVIDELVALSTKYGILTPYTSFLADERVSLHASVANTATAREALGELREVTGRSGVAQRRYKQDLMKADRAAGVGEMAQRDFAVSRSAPAGAAHAPELEAQNSPRATLAPEQKAANGGGSGGAMGRRRLLDAKLAGNAVTGPGMPADAGDRDDQATAPATVRQIGSKTFYWKQERWTDASVTQEEDEKATVITQLSDEYFRLARTQKAENNQYLSLSEPITVKLEGKVYRIDPAKAEPSR